MLDTLPIAVKNLLYKDYLFTEFLDLFQTTYFKFPRVTTAKLYFEEIFYTWEDTVYREMMIEILTKLEPRLVPAGQIVFNTLDEVQELFFIIKGSIDIGFEVNK